MENRLNMTPYEIRILLLLKQGLSNKNISNRVGLSVNTVKYHLKNIYKKLGAKNRVDAINKFNEIQN